MAFGDALRFPFRSEKHWANLGFALVCFLIPIVGPIVLLGYGVLVEKALIADLDAEPPALDFNHFIDHLKRGVPPFVVGLIFVPILMVAMLPSVGLIVVGAARFHQEPALSSVLIGLAIVAYFVLVAASNLLITPMAMKAGLERTIAGAFDWKFVVGFLQRTGWRALGYNLLLMGISILIMPFAICCLVVGPYAFTAWLMFVQFHIRAQLYRLYLDRGGTP